MEKSELRDQFFTEAKTDPWTSFVMHHTANAWAMGYEQALRDMGFERLQRSQSHSERVEMALAWLTEERRKAQAEAIITLASLGKLLPPR